MKPNIHLSAATGFLLISSARFWGQPGELSLSVWCFPFARMNNLQSVLNVLGAEHIFVPFSTLYINFKLKLHLAIFSDNLP